MSTEDKVYRDLQKHLDSQAVGFPATKSGADLRVLKHFFNPQEARLALHLNYKPQSAEVIYRTARRMDITFEEMGNMLQEMAKNGSIEYVEREGTRCYYAIPVVIGMFESKLHKLTPEFLKDFDEYTADRAFGLSFFATELPQARTIPVRESIPLEFRVTDYDSITEIINNTEGPIMIAECICRQKAALQGNPCQQTTRLETCMAFGDMAKISLFQGRGREISKEEALEISRQNEADGLVLQPSNSQKANFVCACCGCCCGLIQAQKMVPKPVDFWATNYYAEVNPENCTACGTCVERCQVTAIQIDKRHDISSVNLDRCIGCGNCVISCPSGAISLRKKEKETVPPEDVEKLYDIIMENKKGKLGKIKLATKIMLKT